MNLKFTLFILSIALVFSSCKRTKYENYIAGQVKLDIGYNYLVNHSGSIIDPISKKELLYFADLITEKKISFFDTEGNLFHKINVDGKVLNYLQAPNGIQVINLDTIIINNRLGQLCVINREGICIKKLDISNHLTDSLGNYYVIWLSIHNTLPTSQQIVYGLDFRINIRDKDTLLSSEESQKKYYRSRIDAAYGIALKDIFTDTFKTQYFQYGFYKFLEDYENVAALEMINIHYNYLTSFYSNCIYKINKDFQIIDSVRLVSKYTEFNFTPYNFNTHRDIGFSAYLDQNTRYRGVIVKILEDAKLIYVIAYHDIKERVEKRPFSLFVLNADLKILKEIPFLDHKYEGFSAIITSKGLFIPYTETQNSHASETTFSTFRFD